MHVRSRVLRVIRRTLHADPAFYMVVARSQDPVKVAAGADRSAGVLTRQLRIMSRDFAVSLPAGAISQLKSSILYILQILQRLQNEM
jgi:hypothetical protein